MRISKILTASLYLVVFQVISASGQTQIKSNLALGESTAAVALDSAMHLHSAGRVKDAEQQYRLAETLAQAEGNDTLLLHATKDLGNLLADGGRNTEALAQYQAGLKQARKLHLPRAEGALLKDIGILYISWKQFAQALHYYDLAEAAGLAANDYGLVADCYNNKGTVYEQQEDFPKALDVYGKALEYYKQAGNLESQAMTLSNLGIVEKRMGNFEKAMSYNLRALALARQTNEWMTAATLNNIGNAFGENGDYEKAVLYCTESIALSRKIKAPEIVYNALESLSDAAAKVGRYKEAWSWHRQFSAAKDSFINTESTGQLAELQVKFETAEKELVLAETQTRAAKTAIAVQRQQVMLWGAGIGLLAIGTISFLAIRNARLRRLRQVHAAELEAIQARQQMQDERMRIGRELHDNIGSQLTLVASSLQGHAHQPERIQEAGALTLQAIRDLRSTVWFINHESCTAEELVVKLREYLRPVSGSGIQVAVELLGEGTTVLSSKASTHLLRIVQEGVNNAVKYSESDTITVIVDDRSAANLQVRVKDSGKGFEIASLSEGFGLQNMQSRARELGGTYVVESAPGKGTQISVAVPLPA